MAFALLAVEAVLATLRRLRAEWPVEFAAIGERIALIRARPDHPRGRGLVRRMPGGALARCCSIPAPERDWLLVWVLDDGEPPAVRLLVLEAAG